MKEQLLNELAAKWECEAVRHEDARPDNATAYGFRKGKAQCAEQLRQLIKLLGEDDGFDGRAMMVKGL
jgi:hypothetical protein